MSRHVVTWWIHIGRPDPKHCYTGFEFKRYECSWCDTWIKDQRVGTFSPKIHEKGMVWGDDCENSKCPVNTNRNGFDEVSSDISDWEAVYRFTGQGGWYGNLPWLFWYRDVYGYYYSSGEVPYLPRGLTWGTWYAMMRGDMTQYTFELTATLYNGYWIYELDWDYA